MKLIDSEGQKMATKRIPYLLTLICLLLTACTIGVVQRNEIIGTPGATIAATSTPDSAAQATIGALSTQNAELITQVAAQDLSSATPTPTTPPTATSAPTAPPTALPTRQPTTAPTLTPTPCALITGPTLQPRLDLNPGYASALGCPTSYQQPSWAAEQVFQRGRMLWKEDQDVAYILFNESGTYQVKDSPYTEGDPEDACPELGDAPEGLVKPVRGFNRQWCDDPAVRDGLGWALEEEAGFYTTWQPFEHGLVLLSRANHVFILYDDGTWDYIE
jgi:hypothetical protein